MIVLPPIPLLPGRVHVGNCLDLLQRMGDKSVQTCITSPPYFGLRDYGHADQIGAEPTPDEFVATLVRVFREVRRVLRDDGTLWLNLGDSYARAGGWSDNHGLSKDANGNVSKRGESGRAVSGFTGEVSVSQKLVPGLKQKDLIGIPWRVAFALQADGWLLRQDIIWQKPNPMPESVTDRCTKAHEYIFLLAKSQKYYFDAAAIKEPAVKKPQRMQADPETARAKSVGPHARGAEGFNHQYADPERVWASDGLRNRRSVWTVTTRGFKGAHFATFPEALIEPCVLAGAPVGGVVLDPFMGAGTTGLVARKNGRNWIGCELNPDYAEMAMERIYSE